MTYASYRAIKELLAQREAFTGNSMSAIRPEGKDRDGDHISHMGMLYHDPAAAAEFSGRTFEYLVFSYGTPIAGVTDDGEVVVNRSKYSVTTSRHQGMLYNLYR